MLSQAYHHMCTDICCLYHLIFSISLVKGHPNFPLENILVPTFNFCGINSNSGSRLGSDWFKPGRGKGDGCCWEVSMWGPNLELKEEGTCKARRQEGLCVTQCELWTKAEPALSISFLFTISHAHCYEAALKRRSSAWLRLLHPVRMVLPKAWMCEPGQCPQCTSCLGME